MVILFGTILQKWFLVASCRKIIASSGNSDFMWNYTICDDETPANIYLFKVNNRKFRKICVICFKLIMNMPMMMTSIMSFWSLYCIWLWIWFALFWHCLAPLLLTLNIFLTFFIFFTFLCIIDFECIFICWNITRK